MKGRLCFHFVQKKYSEKVSNATHGTRVTSTTGLDFVGSCCDYGDLTHKCKCLTALLYFLL